MTRIYANVIARRLADPSPRPSDIMKMLRLIHVENKPLCDCHPALRDRDGAER